jgi:hypothetical protein
VIVENLRRLTEVNPDGSAIELTELESGKEWRLAHYDTGGNPLASVLVDDHDLRGLFRLSNSALFGDIDDDYNDDLDDEDDGWHEEEEDDDD